MTGMCRPKKLAYKDRDMPSRVIRKYHTEPMVHIHQELQETPDCAVLIITISKAYVFHGRDAAYKS